MPNLLHAEKKESGRKFWRHLGNGDHNGCFDCFVLFVSCVKIVEILSSEFDLSIFDVEENSYEIIGKEIRLTWRHNSCTPASQFYRNFTNEFKFLRPDLAKNVKISTFAYTL